MAFIEIVQSGIHSIINERIIQSVVHTTHATLAAHKSDGLPSITKGGYVLVIETTTGNMYFSYTDEMECAKAYEIAKGVLEPKVILLPQHS